VALTIAASIVIGLVASICAEDEPAQKDTTMNSVELINSIVRKMGSGEKVEQAEFRQFVDLQNNNLRTGPPIGSKVPAFALPDQNGKQWRLQDLMGSKGMLLVFTRSADW
jgi:hypothetical protein